MWQIDLQCPQCGASVNLQETERLFACPFCRVKLCIVPHDTFRYLLPPSASRPEETIFIPYWRFRGMSFYQRDGNVDTGVVDVSCNATPFDLLPLSLGLRSQTMRLRFLSPEAEGRFLEPARSLRDALSATEKASEPDLPSLSERIFIGESAGVIFSPVFIRNHAACDGILGKEIAPLPDEVRTELLRECRKAEVSVTFLPSLCPDCGWDLNGEPESAVLTCRNCCSAWRAADGGFEKVPCSFVPMQGDDLLFLPFWKIEAEATGITLNTYADLVHLLNLPMNVSRERREAALEWLTPAFKIGPDQYLKLSQRMTLAQRPAPPETGLPAGSLHPVTLPVKESLEGLKAVAAYSAAARNDPALHLSSIKFRCKNADLIYWPFYTSRIELIRPDRQLSIQVNALRWGRNI